jgi:hypothetical protein
MKKLYKFYLDCGRMGELEGTFVAKQEELEKYYGKTIYFQECLGKHSEIKYIINKEDFTVLSEEQEFINQAIDYHSVPAGFDFWGKLLDYSYDNGWQEE